MKLINSHTHNSITFFDDLMKSEGVTPEEKEKVISSLNIPDDEYTISFYKDEQGSNFLYYYKNGHRINRDNIQDFTALSRLKEVSNQWITNDCKGFY